MKYKLQQINKNVFSAISIIVLLALSACSDDNSAAKEPVANESADTSVVVEDTPISETETAAPESISEADAAESNVTTEKSEAETSKSEVTAEPEGLAVDAGVTLYESNCKVCHDAGLLNAPKYGDQSAWATRLSKGKETLYMHSAKGFEKMPAQAVNGVTEEQVKAAVDYMLASVS